MCLRHIEKGAESCDEYQNWLDGIHSCEQRIQYHIHARHSTSTHTYAREFIYRKCRTISISMYNGFTSWQSLSLSKIHLHNNLIWLFIFKNNLKFHKNIHWICMKKKKPMDAKYFSFAQCTHHTHNINSQSHKSNCSAIYMIYFQQSSLNTFPIRLLCQPLSLSISR